MLRIREEQITAFRAYMRKKFVDRVLGHVREHFPEDFEVLGEAQTRTVIKLGIDRAAEHGFETKGDVCNYITLMFSLGSYFDEDPLLPWAAEAIEGKEGTSPSAMMDDLYAKATEYLNRVAGDKGQYYRAALLRASERPFESLAETNTGNLTHDVRSCLSSLYPQHYHALAESSLKSLAEFGQASAGRYGVATHEGILLYVHLMFMIGSHFDRDPLHPWAAGVLEDESVTDPQQKARKLYEATMARLDQTFRIGRSIGRT